MFVTWILKIECLFDWIIQLNRIHGVAVLRRNRDAISTAAGNINKKRLRSN